MNDEGSTGDRQAPKIGMLAGSGCAIALLVMAAMTAGSILLFRQRGAAAEAATSPGAGGDAGARSDLDAARLDLLALSGEMSDPAAGPVDVARAEQRLDSIDVRLDGLRSEPGWIKVKALGESVDLQLDMVRRKGTGGEVPPLPPATIAPEPDEGLVGRSIDTSLLLKSTIFTPSASLGLRYGPAMIHVANEPIVMDRVGAVDAPAGWKFVDVEIGIEGDADLVEYAALLLDDFLRAFPPYLAGEKELASERKATWAKSGHTVWREVHSTPGGKKTTWLHRVYVLPADSIENPILEIQRQGAAKKVWIQL